MKSLYKVIATKRVPFLVYTDKNLNDPDNWVDLHEHAKDEEDNSMIDEYDFEVYYKNPEDPISRDLDGWDEGSLVYHEGDEDISVSDARVFIVVENLLSSISEYHGVPRSEAQKILIDTMQAAWINES